MLKTPSSTTSLFELVEKDTALTLTTSIYDDGEDHHPPGFIARLGDVVYTLSASNTNHVTVSHTPNSLNGFNIARDEFIIGVKHD